MRVLGLIPARGGSKGIPGKHLRLLSGKPLLCYTAEAALAARRLDSVLLSTDDEGIAALGRSFRLRVPFLRPPELARDETPMFPVVRHALAWLHDRGENYDVVCLLQPTSPLRPAGLIDACLERFLASAADSLVTVLPIPFRHHPRWAYLCDQAGFLHPAGGDAEPVPRRQELAPAFHREGSLYLTRVEVMERYGNLYGRKILAHVVDPARSINLDEEADWRRAEEILAGGRAP